MLNPGQRHDRVTNGVYVDRSGDIHIDCALALEFLRYATVDQVEEWWRSMDAAIAYRVIPIDLSGEMLAQLAASNQWEETANG